MAGKEGSRYYDVFLRHEIWLESLTKEKILTGEGFALLMAIEHAGSLSIAAESLKMSYRKAWGLLRNIEQHLNFPLVKRQRGGARGGRSVLSPEGEALLVAYKALQHETDIAMSSIAKVFFNRINDIPERKQV